jgi:hypothetical protein
MIRLKFNHCTQRQKLSEEDDLPSCHNLTSNLSALKTTLTSTRKNNLKNDDHKKGKIIPDMVQNETEIS